MAETTSSRLPPAERVIIELGVRVATIGQWLAVGADTLVVGDNATDLG